MSSSLREPLSSKQAAGGWTKPVSGGWAELSGRAGAILKTFDRLLLSRLLLTVIWVYRVSFSWLFRGSCRFVPSCSAYAVEAVSRDGALRGLGVMLARLPRCHPFTAGGIDPVP